MTDPSAAGGVQLPPGFSSELWQQHGRTITHLARLTGCSEFHHIGFWVDEPHPQAVCTPWNVYVGPVEDGVELLHAVDAGGSPPAKRPPHFCFAVQEISPHLTGREVTKPPFVGPWGEAAFVSIHGVTVEFLVPDLRPWLELYPPNG